MKRKIIWNFDKSFLKYLFRKPVIKEAVEAVPMSVVEFIDAIEEPLKDQYLPEAIGKTIYASLLGTAANLTPADNVKVTCCNTCH